MTAEERVCEQIREMFGDIDDRLEQAIEVYGRHKFEAGAKAQREADVNWWLSTAPHRANNNDIRPIEAFMDATLITEKEDE